MNKLFFEMSQPTYTLLLVGIAALSIGFLLGWVFNRPGRVMQDYRTAMAVLEQDRDDVKSHRKTHQQCLVDEHILDKYRWMFTSLPRMQGGSWGVSPTDVVVHGLDQEDWFYGEQVRVHLGIQIDEWMQHINKPVLVERK